MANKDLSSSPALKSVSPFWIGFLRSIMESRRSSSELLSEKGMQSWLILQS